MICAGHILSKRKKVFKWFCVVQNWEVRPKNESKSFDLLLFFVFVSARTQHRYERSEYFV